MQKINYLILKQNSLLARYGAIPDYTLVNLVSMITSVTSPLVSRIDSKR